MSGEEGYQWGYFNKIVDADALMNEAQTMADRIASGPTFANGITKTQLNQEWNMSIEAAIEAEAQAQAICMQTKDFERAYHAFVNKEKPEFEGD
jgi:enoyl-CoA hydratase/carnithine racemase